MIPSAANETLQQRLKWWLPMLLNGLDNPKKLPLPLVGSAHPSLLAKRYLDMFSCFFTAHCSVPLLYNGPLRFPPKIAPSHQRIGSPSNTWYLRPTRVFIPNSILIGSAIFVSVPNAMSYNALSMGKKTCSRTDRQTNTHRRAYYNTSPSLPREK